MKINGVRVSYPEFVGVLGVGMIPKPKNEELFYF